MLVVQLISGYTQTEATWNGVQELREKLLSELDEYSALSVRVRLDIWHANWRAVARQLYMLKQRYHRDPFAVIVFAYSWGVGNGLARLAKQLDRFGIDIDHAVIADGVYRHWLTVGNWRAILGDARIVLPANVKRIEGFYQETSYPMGRRPVSGSAHCEPWTKLRVPHVEMDDANEWHDRCLAVASEQARLHVGSVRSVPKNSPESVATEVRKSNGH